jgi:hypothetical protein
MPHLDNVLHTQQQQIDTFGWAVTAVLPDDNHGDDSSPFAYTVGLTRHVYPELVIAGLGPYIAHTILNTAVGRVYDRAERFTHGQHVSGLIAGHDTVIVHGPATNTLHPGTAFALYGRRPPACNRSSGPRGTAASLGTATTNTPPGTPPGPNPSSEARDQP